MTEPDNMRNPSQHKDDPLNAAMQSPDVFLSQRLEQAYEWAVNKQDVGDTVNLIAMIGCTFWTFIVEYFVRGRILKGRRGLVYAVLCAQSMFFKYAILYTLADQEL